MDSIQASDIKHWFPKRVNGPDINKGTFGHVLVFAGSSDFAGAPVLAAEAATRSGAGLVTLATPKNIQASVTGRISSVVMTHGVKHAISGTFGKSSLEEALALSKKASIVALGPGIGLGEEVSLFVREFATHCSVPLVLDADALNALSKESDRGESIIKNRKAATILTPHPGEMGRLLNIETNTIQKDRLDAITRAVKNYDCTILLKGDHTLIGSPDGSLYINTTGNPGMATGGTGDVLTGVIAAMLAQHLIPLHAAVVGAYLHGMAGDIAAEAQGGSTGLIATDLIDNLPQAISYCHSLGHKD